MLLFARCIVIGEDVPGGGYWDRGTHPAQAKNRDIWSPSEGQNDEDNRSIDAAGRHVGIRDPGIRRGARSGPGLRIRLRRSRRLVRIQHRRLWLQRRWLPCTRRGSLSRRRGWAGGRRRGGGGAAAGG